MRRTLLAAALLLAGCAYNGMYHARRLSGDAERAERDGRTIDATAFWGQVTVKAETLLARHPDSKYAIEAKLLLGRAHAHLDDCAAARPILRAALPALADSADIRDARADLARCDLGLGNYAAAAAGFADLMGQGSAGEQRATRLALARSLRMAGRGSEALAALEGMEGRDASEERLLAQAGSGSVAATAALADSLIALRDSTAPWDSVLAALGGRDPVAASHLLDRLAAVHSGPPALHARRLLDDARRLGPVDQARAQERLALVAGGGDEGTAASARMRLIRTSLSQVPDVTGLDSIRAALERESGGSQAADAEALGRVVGRVRGADSITAATLQGDLRLFLAAEAARDSLGAPPLAATLFRRVAQLWPESPYAPKALLAAEALVPGTPDLRSLLDARYPSSPYVAILRGEDAPGLRALEDSLGAFAVAASAARTPAVVRDTLDRGARPASPRPRPGRPGTTVSPR